MAKGKSNYHPDSHPQRIDDTGYRVKCVACGREFESKRFDAAYCSGKCRTWASRAPRRKQTALDDLSAMSFRLMEISKVYKRDPQLFDAMQAVEKTIRIALGRFESEEILTHEITRSE